MQARERARLILAGVPFVFAAVALLGSLTGNDRLLFAGVYGMFAGVITVPAAIAIKLRRAREAGRARRGASASTLVIALAAIAVAFALCLAWVFRELSRAHISSV